MADETNNHQGNADYESKDLEHLSDLEHVRERPSMYIGDTTGRGLHHLVYEVVDNSIDEAMAGHATEVSVTINGDGSVTVEDDGRGIPPEKHEQLSEQMDREVSTLEGVMTVLKFGGKFSKGAYQTSGGLHGVGVTVVNFLSEWAEVEVYRDGHVHHQEYERGVPKGPVRRVGASDKRGTKTTFKPDPQIFQTTKYSYATLQKRLQELAFLNRGVRITITDGRTSDSDSFQYEDGIREFVTHLNRASDAVHADVLYVNGEAEGVSLELAVQYSGEYTENVHTYVNNINTHEGGTHLSGFRAALTRTLNNYGKKEGLFKDAHAERRGFSGGPHRGHFLPRALTPSSRGRPRRSSATARSRGSSTRSSATTCRRRSRRTRRPPRRSSRKASLPPRPASRPARRGSSSASGRAPSPAVRCPASSATAPAKRSTSASSTWWRATRPAAPPRGAACASTRRSCPLRGKIINAYKSRENKVLENNEVRSMIAAIGAGIGAEQDVGKRRYGRVVIMTDADVDGSHIRTLLLTFFYRQMYDLVARGHVYVAQPPLFRVVKGKKTRYVQTEEEMKAELLDLGLGDSGARRGRRSHRRRRSDGQAGPHARGAGRGGRHPRTPRHRPQGTRPAARPRDAQAAGVPRLPRRHRALVHQPQGQLDAFIEEQEKELGQELIVDAGPVVPSADDGGESTNGEATNGAATNGPATNGEAQKRLRIVELHEVRTINTLLGDLSEMGFEIDALIPQERTGEEGSRYTIRRGENETGLEDLRGLPAAIRSAGEKGLADHPLQGPGGNERRGAPRDDARPRQPHAAAGQDGRRRRRRRFVPRADGRPGRTAARFYSAARVGCEEPGRVMSWIGRRDDSVPPGLLGRLAVVIVLTFFALLAVRQGGLSVWLVVAIALGGLTTMLVVLLRELR